MFTPLFTSKINQTPLTNIFGDLNMKVEDKNKEKDTDKTKPENKYKLKIRKEKKWLKLDINTLEDLIQVSKDYGTKYSKDYEYQIDLE